MADFLDRLVAREFGTARYVMPRAGALFEDQPPLELSPERFAEGGTQREFPQHVDLPVGDDDRQVSRPHRDRALDPRAPNGPASIDGSADRMQDEPEDTPPHVSTTRLQSQSPAQDTIVTGNTAALSISRSLSASHVAPEQDASRAKLQPTVVTAATPARSDAPRTADTSPEFLEPTKGVRTKSRSAPDQDGRSGRRKQPQINPDVGSGQTIEQGGRRDATLTPMRRDAARAMLLLPTTHHEVGAAREPDVEITIGRVEVRASRGPAPVAPRDNGQRPLGLADYMQQRHEARRR